MAKYIDSDVLLSKKHGCNRKDCSNCDFFTDGDSWCQGELFAVDVLNAPAADVVEVVRCKDCIHASMTFDGTCKYCAVWSQDEAVYLDGDYYCAAGERKNDG